jgi:hypothetical protein
MVARDGIEPPPAFSGAALNGSYLTHSQVVILFTAPHFGQYFVTIARPKFRLTESFMTVLRFIRDGLLGGVLE